MIRLTWILLTIALVSGCVMLRSASFPQEFGEAGTTNRIVAQHAPGNINYWTQVKPILDKRCVVCHSCYDAPCQTKLTAPEAITRGANTSSPYDTERLFDARPTRLFEDAHSDEEWRSRGFHAILNEYNQTELANQIASPMYRLLEMKEVHPTATNNQRFSEDEFSLEIYRDSTCPTPENMTGFQAKQPNWGMPYALPLIPKEEQDTLKKWLVEGAQYTPVKDASLPVSTHINRWETLLNGDSNKARLVNRYLYEHLFLAHLYFEDSPSRTFFKLVRSETPPGEPVKQIATRRPYDDPDVERVYYRLIPELETVVFKSHLPYALNERRWAKWQQWFFGLDFSVSTLPGYAFQQSANPFATFAQIPAESRYRFLLDEARFTIMNYIKGSVCRGSVALNVIRDQFWVFFVDPDAQDQTQVSRFLETNKNNLAMPSARTTLSTMPENWLAYSRNERKLLKARDKFLQQTLGEPGAIDIDLVWNGDGSNDNAALTIFRHYNRATIEKGLIGEPPETAWLIDYPLLERIHYLLVAGYDVYGNLSHQILTRLHMDFLRIEGEANFLLLLPGETRKHLRDRWYRNTREEMVEYVANSSFETNSEPGIQYKSADHKNELFEILKKHLGTARETRRDIERSPADIQDQLKRIASFSGKSALALPEITYVRVEPADQKPVFFSLLKNNAQTNLSSLRDEESRIIPEETTVTVATGTIGAYPNALLRVSQRELSQFTDQLLSVQTQQDFIALMNRYGIRRTHPDFWTLSDELQAAMYLQDPVEGGIVDYIRLENW